MLHGSIEAVSLDRKLRCGYISVVGWGATGFDGVGEAVVACPGTRVPGKTLGKSQLPTQTWPWLRNLRG